MPISEEFAHLRGPRKIRLRVDEPPRPAVTWRVMLIPTFGDVIQMHEVAGCRFYQPALARLALMSNPSDLRCVLLREPTNPHDANAVAIWTRTGLCGYLPRREAAELAPRVTRLTREHAMPIAVRGMLTPEDFGLGLMIELPEALRLEHL